MTDKTRRRDLMRPVQLLGIAFLSAAFAGIIAAVTMGAFQSLPAEEVLRIWGIAGIVAGIAFIVVLLGLSLLLLVVDPADVQRTIDKPVLRPDTSEDGTDDAGQTPAR